MQPNEPTPPISPTVPTVPTVPRPSPSGQLDAEAAPVDDAAEQSATVTGHLEALADLDGRPLAEHAEIYQRLHTELQQALADIEQADAHPTTSS